jgi:hypothetical protein
MQAEEVVPFASGQQDPSEGEVDERGHPAHPGDGTGRKMDSATSGVAKEEAGDTLSTQSNDSENTD